jgi:hypothetical protein
MIRLFGVKKSGKQNRKNRRLRLEWLEPRELLAGGGIPIEPPPVPVSRPTFFEVRNLPVPAQDILPGASNQVVAEMTVSTVGRQFGRLTEMFFVPGFGSEQISGNTYRFVLRADMNANPKDGCEAVIGSASADYETDLLDLKVYKPVWVRNQPLHLQLTADFARWGFTGDKFGVELAEADFRDLRNQPVPFENVAYTGVYPVLHHLEKEVVSVSQNWDAGVTIAYAGQKEVPMLTFYAWGNGGALTDLELVASKGDMGNVSQASLWASDWRGTQLIEKDVVPQNGKLSFNLASNFVNGAEYQVRANIAATLAEVPSLQLGFPYDGAGLKGIQIESGRPLRDVAVNGQGAGQIQLWTSKSMTYEFKTPVQDNLYATEISKESASWPVPPGAQNITFDSFNVYMAYASSYVTQVAISAAEGDLASCYNYKLWYDSDNNGVVDTVLATTDVVYDSITGEEWVVFNDLNLLIKGTASRMEVRADVSAVPVSRGLRTQLKSIVATLPGDFVHLENALQPYWEFSGYDGGKG